MGSTTKPKKIRKVTVGMPVAKDTIYYDCAESIFNLDRDGVELSFVNSRIPNLAEKRNDIVRQFLELDSEFLLMVDDDMILPPQTASRLSSWDLPVVGALCTQRFPPYAPTAYQKVANQLFYITDIPDSRPFVVDATGTGVLMVKRDVFETIEDPWFEWPELVKEAGEDIVFCDKLKFEGNYSIRVDSGVIAGHIGSVVADIYLHRSQMMQNGEYWEKLGLEELGFE